MLTITINKKSQGMPLNLLVIAGLGLLVLGVVAAGFLIGWGKIGSGISSLFAGGSSQNDVEAVRVRCQTLCRQIDGVLENPCDAKSYSFCTKTFVIDSNTEYCYDLTSCTVSLLSGARKTIDSTHCSCSCYSDSNSCVGAECSWSGTACS